MTQNEEFIGIAATGTSQEGRPPTAVYELGSIIGIVGNGGGGAGGSTLAERGGNGGADSAGENSTGGSTGGAYYAANTLPVAVSYTHLRAHET